MRVCPMKAGLSQVLFGDTQNSMSHPSYCLQVQSSSEGVSKICQLVKHNQDLSLLSLSHSLEFRDVLKSVLGLPCFDVPRWGC